MTTSNADISCGFVAIDENNVNLGDMIEAWPGGIVRVNGDPRNAIMYVQKVNPDAVVCQAKPSDGPILLWLALVCLGAALPSIYLLVK